MEQSRDANFIMTRDSATLPNGSGRLSRRLAFPQDRSPWERASASAARATHNRGCCYICGSRACTRRWHWDDVWSAASATPPRPSAAPTTRVWPGSTRGAHTWASRRTRLGLFWPASARRRPPPPEDAPICGARCGARGLRATPTATRPRWPSTGCPRASGPAATAAASPAPRHCDPAPHYLACRPAPPKALRCSASRPTRRLPFLYCFSNKKTYCTL